MNVDFHSPFVWLITYFILQCLIGGMPNPHDYRTCPMRWFFGDWFYNSSRLFAAVLTKEVQSRYPQQAAIVATETSTHEQSISVVTQNPSQPKEKTQ
jgi:hypothetical protein